MHTGSYQTLFTASSRTCTLSKVSNNQWWNKTQGKSRKPRARKSFHLIWKGGRWTTYVCWAEPRRNSDPTAARCQGKPNSKVKGLCPLDISTYNTTMASREVMDLHPILGHSLELSSNPVKHCWKQSFYYCLPNLFQPNTFCPSSYWIYLTFVIFSPSQTEVCWTKAVSVPSMLRRDN